jgi:hypothetical protein
VICCGAESPGVKNPDGTSRQPRYGMMTLVAEKKNGNWLVVVGQNTNAILGIPPELQDIKTPIEPFPDCPRAVRRSS